MARKVKQYLSNLELEMDEESLQTLSLQCEPATNTRESPPCKWPRNLTAVHAGFPCDAVRVGTERGSGQRAIEHLEVHWPCPWMLLSNTTQQCPGLGLLLRWGSCGEVDPVDRFRATVVLGCFQYSWYAGRGHRGGRFSHSHPSFSHRCFRIDRPPQGGEGPPGQSSRELDRLPPLHLQPRRHSAWSSAATESSQSFCDTQWTTTPLNV